MLTGLMDSWGIRRWVVRQGGEGTRASGLDVEYLRRRFGHCVVPVGETPSNRMCCILKTESNQLDQLICGASMKECSDGLPHRVLTGGGRRRGGVRRGDAGQDDSGYVTLMDSSLDNVGVITVYTIRTRCGTELYCYTLLQM